MLKTLTAEGFRRPGYQKNHPSDNGSGQKKEISAVFLYGHHFPFYTRKRGRPPSLSSATPVPKIGG